MTPRKIPCKYCRSGGTLDGRKAYYCVEPTGVCAHDCRYPCNDVPPSNGTMPEHLKKYAEAGKKSFDIESKKLVN